MTEEILEQKYSLAELCLHYASMNPESDIGRLVGAIGAFHTATLIEELPGERLYIPKPLILQKVFIILSIRQELKELPEQCEEYKARVKELSSCFGLTKNEIKKINDENRSVK